MLSQCQQSRPQSLRAIHGLFHACALVLFALKLPVVKAVGDLPAPIWISTSSQPDWDGNDGPWSTFNLQLGEQKQTPQMVRVVPAFHHGHLVVVAREGCPDGKLPRNCSEHRGGVFDYKRAVWWDTNTKIIGNLTSQFPPGDPLGRINITVSITGDSPTKLPSQNVLLTRTMDPFIGEVGLSQDDETLVTGQLTFLRSALQSPIKKSTSFSYTAGVASTNSPGSLLLGGYDASRFQASGSLNYAMNIDLPGVKRFIVNAKSILTVDRPNTLINLNSTRFVIDPVTPYMWLPVEIMTQLEKALGIQYDPTSQLYLLPSTLARVPPLSFDLESGPVSGSSYRAPSSNAPRESYSGSQLLTLASETLVLNSSYPLYNGTTNGTDSRQYLPFKRGPYPSNGEYTLGRAFFQSVHIIANYDIASFSLAQAKYDPTASRQPTGQSPDSLGPVTTLPGPTIGGPYFGTESSSKLAVILVAVLCTVGVLAITISIYGCCAYRKAKWPFKSRRNQDEDGDVLRTAKAELDGATSSSNDKGLSVTSTEISVVSEMEGSTIPVEMRGSPIVKVELDGDMPSYELDARPKSIDWGNKDADPSVIVRRLLAM